MFDLKHNQPSQVNTPRSVIAICSLGDLIGSYNTLDYWNALIDDLDTPHYTSSELDIFDPLDSPSLENRPRGLAEWIHPPVLEDCFTGSLDLFTPLDYQSLESKPKGFEEDIHPWRWKSISMPEPDIFDPLDFPSLENKREGIWEGVGSWRCIPRSRIGSSYIEELENQLKNHPWTRKSISVPELDIFGSLDYQSFDNKPKGIWEGVGSWRCIPRSRIGSSYIEELENQLKNHPWARKSISVPELDIFGSLDYQSFDNKPKGIRVNIGPSYLEELKSHLKNGFLLLNIIRCNKAWLDEPLYMVITQNKGRVTKPP